MTGHLPGSLGLETIGRLGPVVDDEISLAVG
jgi:hypothetical protein